MQASNYQRHSWQLTLIELIVDIMAFVEDDRMYVFEELIEGHKHRMWVAEQLIGRSQLSPHATIYCFQFLISQQSGLDQLFL